MPAAVASECAKEQGKFWEYHDKVFENQKSIEDADLKKFAQEVGTNVGKWEECVKSEKPKAGIMNDQRLSTVLGARGTPAFFINGRFLSGAQPFPAFQALIDEELKKAKAAGIAQAEYYQKAVVDKGAKSL